MVEKVGRNDPCPCGSGKKYKNCCYGKEVKKTYTPMGKRKFTAKVLSGKDMAQSVFHHLGAPPLPSSSEPYETLRFTKTKEDYNSKKMQEPVFERPEDTINPISQEGAPELPPESFESTTENYEKKD